MPRLSITLTDSQAAALDRIAAETGATKQSMIGLAVSAWIRANDYLSAGAAKAPENKPQALCEVCGAPATGGCIGPDGQHLYCDEHTPEVDLGEDYEQAQANEMFYRAHPEHEWDGCL